jgi:hypothetical protein
MESYGYMDIWIHMDIWVHMVILMIHGKIKLLKPVEWDISVYQS